MTEHWQLQSLSDVLSEAISQASANGETTVSLDVHVSTFTGPSGKTQISASPAASAEKRRASDYRPTAHIEMTLAPQPMPEGLKRILNSDSALPS